MSTVRVVRPRPLGVNDRLPVFWFGQEPSQELKQIDGGALYKHLIASTSPSTDRKRKRRSFYPPPKKGDALDHFTPARRRSRGRQHGACAGRIVIPRVREVADYALNQQAAAHHGPAFSADVSAAPYVRHKELLPEMYEEHQQAEYDVDEDDLAWLNKQSANNGQGLLAAAVGLYRQMSQRISGSNSEQVTPQAPELRLAVDDFERAIDTLELLHYNAVKAWWEEQQTGPSTSAPHVPRIPAMKQLLPRAAALAAVYPMVPDQKLAAQLIDYWLKKRQAEGGPVLARLWYEQPWKLVAFADHMVDDDEDYDEHLPFMAVEPRSVHKHQNRRSTARRKVTEEDALDALHGLRNELEVVRTLADQVRRREKLKRQLLIIRQQEWQMRGELGLSGPLPALKEQRRRSTKTSAAAGADALALAGAGVLPGSATPDGPAAALILPARQPSSQLQLIAAAAAAQAAAAASPAGKTQLAVGVGRNRNSAAAATAAGAGGTQGSSKLAAAQQGQKQLAGTKQRKHHQLRAVRAVEAAAAAAENADGTLQAARQHQKGAIGRTSVSATKGRKHAIQIAGANTAHIAEQPIPAAVNAGEVEGRARQCRRLAGSVEQQQGEQQHNQQQQRQADAQQQQQQQFVSDEQSGSTYSTAEDSGDEDYAATLSDEDEVLQHKHKRRRHVHTRGHGNSSGHSSSEQKPIRAVDDAFEQPDGRVVRRLQAMNHQQQQSRRPQQHKQNDSARGAHLPKALHSTKRPQCLQQRAMRAGQRPPKVCTARRPGIGSKPMNIRAKPPSGTIAIGLQHSDSSEPGVQHRSVPRLLKEIDAAPIAAAVAAPSRVTAVAAPPSRGVLRPHNHQQPRLHPATVELQAEAHKPSSKLASSKLVATAAAAIAMPVAARGNDVVRPANASSRSALASASIRRSTVALASRPPRGLKGTIGDKELRALGLLVPGHVQSATELASKKRR